MDFEPRVLFDSDAFRVRVAPPDSVIISVAGHGGERTLRCGELRGTSVARVETLRAKEGADAFPGVPDNWYAIELSFTDGRSERLGPFETLVALRGEHAMETAMSDFVLEIDGLMARVPRGRVVLRIEHELDRGAHISVPVWHHTLKGAAVRAAGDAALDHTVRAGEERPAAGRLGSTGAPRFYVELLGSHDPPMSVGPFTQEDAERLAQGLDAWCRAQPPDDAVVDVPEAVLSTQPTRFHLRRVRATGTWEDGAESSTFCGAWLTVPDGTPRAADRTTPRRVRARVVGRWVYPRQLTPHDRGGYGPSGRSPGELMAESVEVLD